MRVRTRRILFSLAAIAAVLGTIGISYAVVQANSGIHNMPTSAMAPTIKAGQSFRSDMYAYDSASPKRWDVVVFRSPQKKRSLWVFRIVGMPGETISFDENGLLIGGRAVELPGHLSGVRYNEQDDRQRPHRSSRRLPALANWHAIS